MSGKFSSTVSKISNVEQEISIVVPAAEVTKQIGRAYNRISAEVKMPGFRPGKVPRALLEKRFGGAATQQALEDIISESLRDVLVENNINPVSKPTITENDELSAGKDFSYRVKVETLPEIVLGDYENLSLKVPKFQFDDKDIDKELESMRRMFGHKVPVEDRTNIVEGDLLDISFTAVCDEEKVPALSHEEFSLLPCDDKELFPEVHAALLNQSVPCDFAVSVIVKEDSPFEKFRGKTLKVSGSVRALKTLKIPALDDEFARDVSSEFKDLEELKEFVKMRLDRERQQRDKNALFESVAEFLVKANHLEIPPSMVEEQARAIAAESLAYFSKEEAQKFWEVNGENMLASCKEKARNSLHIMMLAQAIADKEKIEVTQEEISAEIGQEIARRNMKRAEVEKTFTQDRVRIVAQQLRIDKALEFVASKATITTELRALSDG